MTCPIEPDESIDTLPYLPDPLARGAAIRNLPGSSERRGRPCGARRCAPQPPSTTPSLSDANPRPGSATLVSFNATGDWQQTTAFRLALGELPAGESDARPLWDPAARVLTVYLPKGHTAVVPLSSYVTPEDLKLMGLWQWLREFVDLAAIFFAHASPPAARPSLSIASRTSCSARSRAGTGC